MLALAEGAFAFSPGIDSKIFPVKLILFLHPADHPALHPF
jgi:hypothetical protein